MTCRATHRRPLINATRLGGWCAALALAATPSVATAQVFTLPTRPAGPSTIAPGITYERVTQSDGRVVHVVRTQPGVARIVPFLPGGSVSTTGSLQEALAARSTSMVAAVNGDFFNLNAAYPSGMTVIDNRLMSEPEASRSALVVAPDGTLSAGRFTLQGSWQTINPDGSPLGLVRRFPGINRPAEKSSEMLLYTSDFGRATSTGDSRNEAVIRLDQGITGIAAIGSVTGTVVAQNAGGGALPDPSNVVITGLGSNRAAVVSDLPLGQRVRIDTLVGGFPAGAQAVGGGPLLVDGGDAVSAGEGFSSAQTDQRTTRTAVGQLADGGYILVTVEGPAQGGPGVSVAEQASIMDNLGARVAVAMDAGGSAQMVVDGWQAVPWSQPRSITTAVGLAYNGVRVLPTLARITPNADGVDDATTATVVSPVAGTLSVALVRRGGSATSLLRTAVPAGPSAVQLDPAALKANDGPYRLAAELTPADGSAATTASRDVVIDRTLGSLKARKVRTKVGRARLPMVDIGFQLARPARVTVRIENEQGVPVRVLSTAKLTRPGPQKVTWDRKVGGRAAKGRVRVVVITRSSMGTSGLVTTVSL